tara:strand:- start:122 stop:667 length:546 start_codon:yes stop_codon:yes gene_type:complete
MQTWVALLRGINVGGNNIIPMKILTQIMTDAGYEGVQSYIQSGNVVFQHTEVSSNVLASELSLLIQRHFDFQPKVMLLTATEFNQILAQNPYKQAYSEPKQVHFFFVDEIPASPDLTKLKQLKSPSETYELQPQGLYLFAPEGIGRSKLVAKVDKCLGVNTTARNLNTLLKLKDILKLKTV